MIPGKSELAKSMEDLVTAQGGFFLFGKFEQYRHQAFPFFNSMEQFTKLLQLKDPSSVERVSKAVHNAVGSEARMLVEAMPFLGSLLNFDPSAHAETWREDRTADKGNQRFTVAFRRLVRAIISPEQPVVLVLDDLQWADDGSLNLLHNLATLEFGNRRGLLLLATVRGNEVKVHDQLSRHLRELEEKGTCITTIEVANLRVDTLARMIEDAGMPTEHSSTLAEIVHNQTRGNALFSTQYVRHAMEDGLLKQESSDTHWEFHLEELNLSSRGEGHRDSRIVGLLAKKIKQLPRNVQEVLMVAACIGSEVRENLLFHACTLSSSSILLALSIAEDRGLIMYDFDAGVGRYCHDR
jgi:predicted ATPase